MARRTHSQLSSVGFKNIQLFKEKTLGIGSYGKVCRAKCDNLLCAAKIIHETLFDPTAAQQMPRGHEHRLPIRRFEQECEFLNTIRHPNVIQYLGIYRDPDTGLPVLLMELMDESLTHFLETATQSIPYHVQVNICHDIALALAFLHANGIFHRDLSSNNVLLISNVRAKVTDFGMAKLGDLNPRMSKLTFTMCPGTDVYMPPEAVQDKPVYTEKIDCFSFGVIVVQTLTGQFPKPDDRLRRVEMNHPGLPRGSGTLMVCVPEVDRRQNHISQIDPNNILLPIALDCLKDRDDERPSAQQLCERVAALKESDNMYAESITFEMKVTQNDLQYLRKKHTKEIQNLKESLIREQERIIAAKDYEIQDLLKTHDEAIATKEQECEQLRMQFEQIQCKVNNEKEEELDRQLKQVHLDLPSNTRDHTLHLGIKSDSSLKCSHHDIRLTWRKGKPAPQKMYRWCNAVADKTVVYFNTSGTHNIHCYNTSSGLWIRLDECPYVHSSFLVINKMLTAIGGFKDEYSNTLYSLKQGEVWVEEFPPMPTKRASTTAVRTESSLIVVGGEFKGGRLHCPVEVMCIASRQWSIVSDLPIKNRLVCASGVICCDQLYILGARNSESVYSCSLSDLLQSRQTISEFESDSCRQLSVWRQLADLPFYYSTCISFCDNLLAIGGNMSPHVLSKSTSSVYTYKPTTNSWEAIDQMFLARRLCFAIALHANHELMVVGGRDGLDTINSVEFASLILP